MFFCKKINRVVDVKKAEERFQKDLEKTPLEKNDRTAMILAGLIVFVPALLVVLLVAQHACCATFLIMDYPLQLRAITGRPARAGSRCSALPLPNQWVPDPRSQRPWGSPVQ